ncbi:MULTISPECIES: LysR family transcriptional regulator [Brucella/Ochrobactrum group]|uniref:LysR family transcriptional regulator n=1 Tax=Brucella pseudintermedia TaxID=370111 RepID=A0ABY5UIF8_9HYPH|nr:MULTISPECIES: LysR family transcriptional regulator [Brucella/Ochrobactrum group]MCH4543686.1 LysR family transcriptional regulator [Ochrobactrum sp. A-1]UWL61799.1 LysR family transcriptional regulator [Brucella pseudintermedia]
MQRRDIAKHLPAASELDLGALRIFVAVAEAGSFVGGGKAVGLTRSAAGKALARLEAYLGTRLFHRTTRRLSLTTEGHEFYHRSRQLLEDLAEAEASIRPNRLQPRGTLRLTVSEGYGKAKIIPYLATYLETAPDLAVEVSFTDRMVDLVEEGFDLAIRVGSVATSGQYITQVIDRTRLGLYASPDYLLKRGKPASTDELRHHQRLIYGLGTTSTVWNLLREDDLPITIEGGVHIRFDSGDAIRVAALAGLGIALLPSFIVEQDITDGKLVEILPKTAMSEAAIHAIYPSRRHLSIRTRSFIEGLKRSFR